MGNEEHEGPIDEWIWMDRDESKRLWNALAETNAEEVPADQEEVTSDQKGSTGAETDGTAPTDSPPSAGEAGPDRRIWDDQSDTAGEEDEILSAESSDRVEDESADDRLWNQSSGDAAVESGQSAGKPAEGRDAKPFDVLSEEDRAREGGSAEVAETGTQSDQRAVEALFDDIEEFHSLAAGSQVLVVSHPDHERTDEICPQFLTVGDQTERNVLFVTTGQSPARRLDVCQRNESWSGGKVKVLTVGDEVSDTHSEGPTEIRGNGVTYEHVSSPTNISKIGVIITQTLKEWRADDRQTTICFHSLSTLGQYVKSETLFKFVFTLKRKLDSFGITGHYHMNPAKHDEQEIGTFSPMFDFTIRVSQDGTIDID